MARPGTTHREPHGDRRATAPYNFVRLPQRVLPATELWPDGVVPWKCHDRYVPGLHTGYVDLDITTLSPLFIGPPALSRTGTGWAEPPSGTGLRSFRLTPDGSPVIPGSSINGLLDTMIRILAYARPDLIWDPTLWMRQPVTANSHPLRVATERRGRRYAYLRNGGTKPTEVSRTAGFLRREVKDGEARWYVEPLDTRPIGPDRKDAGADFFVPFAEHAPYKVRHELIVDMFDGVSWRAPDDRIEYSPQENAAWFQREVVFLTCDLLTQANDTFHRVNVVVGVVPADDEDRRATVDARRQEAKVLVGRALTAPPEWLARSVPGTSQVQRVLRVHEPRAGVLVLTGTTGNGRNNEYVFPHPSDPDQQQEKRLPIDAKFVRELDSANQITPWQEDTFPPDPARPDARPANGRLGDGDPVWYEAESVGSGKKVKLEVTSFGRAGGYRVPYEKKLGDLLPEELRRTVDPLDVSQGLFGDVQGRTAIRRRVSAGHAVLLTPPSGSAHELAPVQVGLLAPNRQSYTLYLTQPSGNLRDFDGELGTGALAEPRGFKLYLHRWDGGLALPAHESEPAEWKSDIVPLRPGLVFRCRVRFTNLSQAEIGLLLRAALLANEPGTSADDPVSAHKLGRGRPLGLGSVHLAPTLHLLDPAIRYTGSTDGFSQADNLDPYLAVWDELAVRHARDSGEEPPDSTDWRGVDRLRELALAASWRGRLAPEDTAHMQLERFAEDRVLPGLLHLFGGRSSP